MLRVNGDWGKQKEKRDRGSEEKRNRRKGLRQK